MRMNSTELLWAHISASLVLLPNQSNVSSFYCMMTSIPLIGLELGCVHIGGKKLIKFLHLAEKVYLLLKMNLFVVLQTRSWNNGNRFILGCCKKRSRSVPKSPHIWGKTHARFGKSRWRSICNIGCTCLQVSLSLWSSNQHNHTPSQSVCCIQRQTEFHFLFQTRIHSFCCSDKWWQLVNWSGIQKNKFLGILWKRFPVMVILVQSMSFIQRKTIATIQLSSLVSVYMNAKNSWQWDFPFSM